MKKCIRYSTANYGGHSTEFITFSMDYERNMKCHSNYGEIKSNGDTMEWFNCPILGLMSYSKCALDNWEDAKKELNNAWDREL